METIKTIISEGLGDLEQVAKEVIAGLTHPLVLFEGELGAGKTTLIKELLKQLGSKDEGSSPSYSLINEYATDTTDKIYHLDLYRLNTAEEAFALGLEDILYSGHYCLVEWPQIVKAYLDPPYQLIEISIAEEGHRLIKLSSF